MCESQTFRTAQLVVLASLVFLSTRDERVFGQSSDQSLPTAVRSSEINGRIRALDLGDSRLTRHFYAFDGTPGDLIITLESKNLNGDIDVFTAVTFRPLMKISMYAETQLSQTTKSLYLRTRQILILRVEARTPNDEPGTYRVRFSGSFQPFSGGIPVAETTEPSNEGEKAEQSNVSSVGERIETPPKPVSETKPTEETAKAPLPTPAARSTRNSPRGRGTRRAARTRPAPKPTQSPKPETAKTETTEPAKPAEGEEKSGTPPEEKPAPTNKTETEKPAPQPSGPHLIIERSDGNRLDRPMSAVRRVVIESGVIVVTLKNGRVERIPLSVIVKMSIEP